MNTKSLLIVIFYRVSPISNHGDLNGWKVRDELIETPEIIECN